MQPDICSSSNCRDETGYKEHGVSSPNPVSWILTGVLGAYICVLGEPSGLCGLVATEMSLPSLTWNIIMCLQFALIVILGLFHLYDYLLAYKPQIV